MNLLDKELLSVKCLQAIKRKQRYFSSFINKIQLKHVLLDKDLVYARICELGKKLAFREPSEVVVLCSNTEHLATYRLFSYMTKYKLITNYIRGNFNNCIQNNFLEARVLFSCHDRRDRRALLDAKKERLLVYGFSNLARGYRFYDYFVPANTFSNEAMNIYFYLLYVAIKQSKDQSSISFEEYCNITL